MLITNNIIFLLLLGLLFYNIKQLKLINNYLYCYLRKYPYFGSNVMEPLQFPKLSILYTINYYKQ